MIDLSQKLHIHCIGIGGVGLSAVAEILLSRGHDVSGSDINENDNTDRLIKHGAKIYLNHREKNIEGADLVVYSAAIAKENPEMLAAKSKGIPLVARADMLGELMQDCKYSVAVAGTHGKTTTTSMLALILEDAKKDPTVLVGGNLKEIGGNVKAGNSDYFVTEACEYMDSFLYLNPMYAIILNIDSDHLDYFEDIDHIVKSFDKFANLVPDQGAVVAYDSNPFVSSIMKNLDKRIITFGFHEGCNYYASDITFNSEGMPYFSINKDGEKLTEMQLKIPGEHNIANALSAFATAYDMGVDCDSISKSLSEYVGIQRRFDIMGSTHKGVKIVDDYAHHPTEIQATLEAAKNISHNNIWCLFQPHTYTRTLALHDAFAESFEKADKIIIAEIYAAREANTYKATSRIIVDEIHAKFPGKSALFIEDFDDIAEYVLENAEKNDMVITMGAGDIYRVGELILEKDVARYLES